MPIGRRNGNWISHTRAGMSAYKKVSPGTNVEIADGNILPVDGFGRIEVDLDQPGHTTKMVKMDDVAYQVCAKTLPEPAVYRQSGGAMGKSVNLL